METQIFYWTGVVFWWGICAIAMAVVVAAVVVAPLLSYRGAKKYFWQWRWAAEISHTGFTQADVQYACAYAATPFMDKPGKVPVSEMLKWVEEVKERGRIVKLRKEEKQDNV